MAVFFFSCNNLCKLCSVINVLNNKTLLLNLAQYPLIFYQAIFRGISQDNCSIFDMVSKNNEQLFNAEELESGGR